MGGGGGGVIEEKGEQKVGESGIRESREVQGKGEGCQSR